MRSFRHNVALYGALSSQVVDWEISDIGLLTCHIDDKPDSPIVLSDRLISCYSHEP